jgi:hypothetical protein
MVQATAKLLLAAAAVLAVAGLVLLLLGKIGVGRLPGDLAIHGRGTTVVIPIATSILISLLLTGILWLVRLLRR